MVLSETMINKMQRDQNTAPLIISKTSQTSDIIQLLKQLHWSSSRSRHCDIRSFSLRLLSLDVVTHNFISLLTKISWLDTARRKGRLFSKYRLILSVQMQSLRILFQNQITTILSRSHYLINNLAKPNDILLTDFISSDILKTYKCFIG